MDIKRFKKDLQSKAQKYKIICAYFRTEVLEYYENADRETQPLERLRTKIQDQLDANQIDFSVNKNALAVYLYRNKTRIMGAKTNKPPQNSTPLLIEPKTPKIDLFSTENPQTNKDPFDGLVPQSIKKDFR